MLDALLGLPKTFELALPKAIRLEDVGAGEPKIVPVFCAEEVEDADPNPKPPNEIDDVLSVVLQPKILLSPAATINGIDLINIIES